MGIATRIDGMIVDTYLKIDRDFQDQIKSGAMEWIVDQPMFSQILELEIELFEYKDKVGAGQGSLAEIKKLTDQYYDIYKEGFRRYDNE